MVTLSKLIMASSATKYRCKRDGERPVVKAYKTDCGDRRAVKRIHACGASSRPRLQMTGSRRAMTHTVGVAYDAVLHAAIFTLGGGLQ
jgi:hypothetical protein